jgi:hypothetical protein
VAELKVHPPLLQDQARKYSEQARAIADTMKVAAPLLEELRTKGLGWDEGGRKFAQPYSVQQDKVVDVLTNMSSVLAEINEGLTILARRLPQADEDTAAQFKRLTRQVESTPNITPFKQQGGTPFKQQGGTP